MPVACMQNIHNFVPVAQLNLFPVNTSSTYVYTRVQCTGYDDIIFFFILIKVEKRPFSKIKIIYSQKS